jgi:hypothetical protein
MKEYKNRRIHKIGKYVKAVAIPAEWLKFHEIQGDVTEEVNLEVYEDKIIVKPIFEKKKKKLF